MPTPAPANKAPAFIPAQLGHTGMVKVDFGKSLGVANSVALQPDGKIVVLGLHDGLAVDTGLLRLNSDGSLDTSFGSQGKTIVHVPDRSTESFGLALTADGAIVVVGATGGSLQGQGYVKDLNVMRFDEHGRLDTGFSGDGMASFDLGSPEEAGLSVVLQADGKLVVAGYTHSPLTPSPTPYGAFSVVRLKADGRLDTGFGSAGMVSIDFGPRPDGANDLVVQGDGKILVAGYSQTSTKPSFSLVRLEADGKLDAGFGDGGRVSINLNDSWDLAHSVTLQQDGKILVAGYSDHDFGLIRLDTRGRWTPASVTAARQSSTSASSRTTVPVASSCSPTARSSWRVPATASWC